MKPVIFTLLLIAAFGMFARTVSRLVRFLLRGRPEAPPARMDRWPERLASVAIYFLGQKKVAEPPSYTAARRGITSRHHQWIFWGFLLITIGTVELLVAGVAPSFSLAFIGETPYRALKLLIDWMSLIVLLMIGYAFFRRLVLKPRLIPMSLDAGLILGMIAGLMVTHFAYHAFHFASAGTQDIAGPLRWMDDRWFISYQLAEALGGGGAGYHTVADVAWWTHVLILLAFLNYIPFSKHIHLLGALPNILFRNLDARIVGTKRNLEDENDYGVGKLEQLTWKQMLDGYACTECARCSNYCPAFNTDKPLSPMHLIHDIKHEMMERGALELKLAHLEGERKEEVQKRLLGSQPEDGGAEGPASGMEPFVGGRIKDETLWACTTCGACQEVCPVFI